MKQKRRCTWQLIRESIYSAVDTILSYCRYNQAISKIVPLAEAATTLQNWSDNPTSFSKTLVRVNR
jgi:hypothetical protein